MLQVHRNSFKLLKTLKFAKNKCFTKIGSWPVVKSYAYRASLPIILIVKIIKLPYYLPINLLFKCMSSSN